MSSNLKQFHKLFLNIEQGIRPYGTNKIAELRICGAFWRSEISKYGPVNVKFATEYVTPNLSTNGETCGAKTTKSPQSNCNTGIRADKK